MSDWHKLCVLTDLDRDDIFALTVADLDLIVVLDGEGEPRVFKDLCSHQDVKLSDFGEITAERELICHAHAARFCLKDGAPLCHPATSAITPFPVKVENGAVFALLPAP